VIFYKNKKNDIIEIIIFLFLALGFVVFMNSESLFTLTNQLYKFTTYIIKQQTNLFPNVGISNSEQQALPLSALITISTNNYIAFIMAIIGLFFIIKDKKQDALFLLPVLAVGMLSVLFADRFKIFFPPVISICFGYFCLQLYSFRKLKVITIVGITVLLTFITITSLKNSAIRAAVFDSESIAGMDFIRKTTEPEAVIWSWWDLGHPLNYWTERATVADGSTHGPERTIYTSFPFATDDPRLAANFMKFYCTHGIQGIHKFYEATGTDYQNGFPLLQKILSAGPQNATQWIEDLQLTKFETKNTQQSWLDFFFPHDSPPVYLYINSRIIETKVQRWIYWYSTWDTLTQSGDKVLLPLFINSKQLKSIDKKIKDKNLSINLTEGTITLPYIFQDTLPLNQIIIHSNSNASYTNYVSPDDSRFVTPRYAHTFSPPNHILPFTATSGQYSLHIFPETQSALLLDKKNSRMLAKKLYFSRNTVPVNYFQPIETGIKTSQLWKVTGDRD